MWHEGRRESLEGRKGASERNKGGPLGGVRKDEVWMLGIIQRVKCLSYEYRDLGFFIS